MRHLIIIVTLLSTFSPLCAQEMRLRRVTVDNGLPQSYVNKICQDTVGHMWFGTQDGLGRFDGRNMKVYRHHQDDTTSLPTNNITELHLSSAGTLCVGTGGGYCMYQSKRDSWRRASREECPRPKHSAKQNVVFDGSTNVTYIDHLGRHWIGTASKGLYVVDTLLQQTIRFNTTEAMDRRIASNEIWALHEDCNGVMWVGTNGGGIAVIKNDHVYTILRHDPRDASTLSSDVVRCLFEDNIGTIWIGTFGGGVCQYDPYSHLVDLVRPSNYRLGFPDDFVRGITKGQDGWMYIGLRTGVVKCNEHLGAIELVAQWNSEYEAVGAPRALYLDRLNNLWIGTERRGVGVIRKGSTQISWMTGRSWCSRPGTTTVSSITEIAVDKIAIGTDGGIALVNITSLIPQWCDVPRRPEISDERIPVSSIARIANTDEFLIGTEAGLFRGLLDGPQTYLNCPDVHAARPSVDIIRSIVVAGNRAFVGTWNGGVRIVDLQGGGERVVDRRVGLPSDVAYAVFPLSEVRMLISSNAGILIWNVVTNTLEQMVGSSQGAQSLEFNSWSWYRTIDGTIYLGGVSGINRVQPKYLRMPPAPSLMINELKVAGRDLTQTVTDGAGVLSLEHDANSLYVSVSAIALSLSLPVEYRYKVSAEDSMWAANATGDVQIPALSPGSYMLVLQARYKDGTWGKATVIRINVKYPYWQSWWFILLIASALSAVVWGVAVLVTRRREAEAHQRERLLQEERLRIARDLHDDVGTGLAKIVILSENSLADHVNSDAAKAVAETAREVIDSVRSIVWIMKSNDESLAAALGYVRDKIGDLFDEKGIHFVYDQRVPEGLLVDLLVRRNIVLAVKELATNIVRHSGARNVTISASVVNSALKVEVRDDGAGFEMDSCGNGSGIANIRTRMEEVGGTMLVEALTDLGTRITLTIPMDGESHEPT